ncbi:MAG TPA: helix-turn-helix domain-containing protein [Thermoanaerobaculia bacterium]|nr:helix-turn-helix domain-containing protein [Thermoanaerobaculia bacterium]
MSSIDAASRALEAVGLTDLEARCYAFLQGNGAATGYTVAKGVGRPTANVYKALESLRLRGALEVEEGKPRLCRAVPSEEFLATLERGFQQRRSAAAQRLAEVRAPSQDSRVYHLQTPEQVFERFRSLLAEVEEVALLDLFPGAAARLAGDLAAAADRGVLVVAKVYARLDLGGAVTLVQPAAKRTLERWRGEWANGVFDGRQHLLALLDRDLSRVHQAVWSGSDWVSWVYHGALVHELRQIPVRGAARDAARAALRDARIESAPGYRQLTERLAADVAGSIAER